MASSDQKVSIILPNGLQPDQAYLVDAIGRQLPLTLQRESNQYFFHLKDLPHALTRAIYFGNTN